MEAKEINQPRPRSFGTAVFAVVLILFFGVAIIHVIRDVKRHLDKDQDKSQKIPVVVSTNASHTFTVSPRSDFTKTPSAK